jgi:hypothetical protein
MDHILVDGGQFVGEQRIHGVDKFFVSLHYSLLWQFWIFIGSSFRPDFGSASY